MILKTSTRGGVTSITFGTTKRRPDLDRWDGAFPVEVHMVYVIGGESTGWERNPSRAMRPDTLDAAIRRVGRGWRHRASDGWIQLRTPAKRRGGAS